MATASKLEEWLSGESPSIQAFLRERLDISGIAQELKQFDEPSNYFDKLVSLLQTKDQKLIYSMAAEEEAIEAHRESVDEWMLRHQEEDANDDYDRDYDRDYDQDFDYDDFYNTDGQDELPEVKVNGAKV